MSENTKLKEHLNKILIPCRTVLEFEALTSLYLTDSNYKKIKKMADYLPSSQRLIKLLNVEGNQLYENIIKYFINYALPKIKALPTDTRDHSDKYRKGDIITSKSNTCLYLALHRLKLKFLIIKSIVDEFKANDYNLEYFNKEADKSYVSFLSVLADMYHKLNKRNLELMFPKKMISERIKKLLNNQNAVTGEKLLNLIKSKKYTEKTNIIKFVMREIKASLFICKMMFAKMDVNDPFCITKERIIDVEEIMVSNDFIPELIPALSRSLRYANEQILNDCLKAFYFFMDQILEGINNAIRIASRNQIELEKYELIYYTGDLFNN